MASAALRCAVHRRFAISPTPQRRTSPGPAGPTPLPALHPEPREKATPRGPHPSPSPCTAALCRFHLRRTRCSPPPLPPLLLASRLISLVLSLLFFFFFDLTPPTPPSCCSSSSLGSRRGICGGRDLRASACGQAAGEHAPGDGVVRGVRREARGRAGGGRRRRRGWPGGAIRRGGLAVGALQEEGLLLT